LAGRISEETRFGSKIGRIDVPTDVGCTGVSANWCPRCGDCCCKEPESRKDDEACPLHSPTSKHGEAEGKFVTIFFSGSSIYRMTPCDEPTARAVAARSAPAPIQPYEMPKQLVHAEPRPGYPDEDDLDDDSPYDPEE
jgi:hypothetical protein